MAATLDTPAGPRTAPPRHAAGPSAAAGVRTAEMPAKVREAPAAPETASDGIAVDRTRRCPWFIDPDRGVGSVRQCLQPVVIVGVVAFRAPATATPATDATASGPRFAWGIGGLRARHRA